MQSSQFSAGAACSLRAAETPSRGAIGGGEEVARANVVDYRQDVVFLRIATVLHCTVLQ